MMELEERVALLEKRIIDVESNLNAFIKKIEIVREDVYTLNKCINVTVANIDKLYQTVKEIENNE